MHATMATMLVLAERPDVAFDGAFLNGDPVLSWISRNASKPGRLADETWVLHATREWSTAHLETDTRQIAELMTDAFQRVIGTSVEPAHRAAHRWKYALPDPVVPDAALFDAALGLGAAGDWCGGPRVEGALLSGVALAGRVMTHASGAPMLQAGGRITASRT
jgi:renalase